MFGKFYYKEQVASRDKIVLVLGWTYIMLLSQYCQNSVLKEDYRETCNHLEKILLLQDAEGMEDPSSVDEWGACYRHTEEYYDNNSSD